MNVPLVLTGGLLGISATGILWRRLIMSFRDPRWRSLDWISRPASEGEIYSLKEQLHIAHVTELKPRRLRLHFAPPIPAKSWRIFRNDQDLGEHTHPDLTFADDDDGHDFSGVPFRVEPVGTDPMPVITLRMHYFPKHHYAKAGLSWPDAYTLITSSVPARYRPGYSLSEWVGLQPDDPDLAKAREAMQDEVDFRAPILERQEQVFRFLMRRISIRTGLPDDALLNANAWNTWERVRDGHDAFCELKALIYYLFANAVGIPTRLVDLMGTMGPIVLTGHYIAESWIPEEQAWMLVDPHTRDLAWVRDPSGRLLHTIALKHRYDAGTLADCTIRQYDRQTRELVTRPLASLSDQSMNWIRGPLVIAFKFGYPRNRGYSRLRTFFRRPTLLYSPLELPQPRRKLWWCLAALGLGLIALIVGMAS